MSIEKVYRIGVLGTGTWGIALARLLANKGYDVTSWSAIESEIDVLTETKRHPNLPEMVIPENLKFTKNIEDSVFIGETASGGKHELMDLIMLAVPSIFIRSTAKRVSELISEKGDMDNLPIFVTVAKGIESGTHFTMAQIIEEELEKALSRETAKNARVVALSGPTHAEEVAFDMPTAIVSACANEEAAELVQEIFMTSRFRVYTNSDVDGVELCGAMKNVIALSVGISKGLGNGDNARAALITRGMEEIKRLGQAMGCKEETFSGLAGIGDLIVTATSEHSRNNRCGQLIGQGLSPEEAVKKVGMVVEGLNALPSIMELSEKYNVEVPISQMLDNVINKKMNPKDAALILMSRERKAEF